MIEQIVSPLKPWPVPPVQLTVVVVEEAEGEVVALDEGVVRVVVALEEGVVEPLLLLLILHVLVDDTGVEFLPIPTWPR